MKERRKKKRYKNQSGARVVFNPNLSQACQLVDISEDGLAVLLANEGDVVKNASELAILMDEKTICIDKIPFTIKNDFAKVLKSIPGNEYTKRIGVRFGELTDTQRMQLEHFIWMNNSSET